MFGQKQIYRLILLLLTSLLVLPLSVGAQQRLMAIFDTDMGNSVDDTLAVSIRRITSCTDNALVVTLQA